MGIERGRIETAVRRAYNGLDKWNDVAGIVRKDTGYYFELQSVIEDAVHCGIQAALEVEDPLPSEKREGGEEKVHCYCRAEMEYDGNEWKCTACGATRPDNEPR